MSEKPGTTIGFERRFNRLLTAARRGRVRARADGNLAPQPPNFKRIVALNRGPLLTDAAPLEPLRPRACKDAPGRRARRSIDGRDTLDYDGGTSRARST